MKHFLKTTIIAICLFGLMACKKNSSNDPNLVTISGQVVKSCDDHTPVPGLEIYVSGDKSNAPLGTCKPKRISTITDENGRFSISYDTKKDLCMGTDILDLMLAYDDENGNYRTFLHGLPTSKKDDIDFTNEMIHLKNTIHLIVEMQIYDISYTNKDTILIPKIPVIPGVSNYKVVPGPFYDRQIIDTLIVTSQFYNQNLPCVGFHGYFVNNNGEKTKISAPSESCYNCSIANKVFLKLP